MTSSRSAAAAAANNRRALDLILLCGALLLSPTNAFTTTKTTITTLKIPNSRAAPIHPVRPRSPTSHLFARKYPLEELELSFYSKQAPIEELELSYGEQSRLYRRDFFNHELWVYHRVSNTYCIIRDPCVCRPNHRGQQQTTYQILSLYQSRNNFFAAGTLSIHTESFHHCQIGCGAAIITRDTVDCLGIHLYCGLQFPVCGGVRGLCRCPS